MAGAVSGVFSFFGVEHLRTQNIQGVWKDSVMFSPGFQKSSIEYEVTTHYTYRPLAAILELGSNFDGAMLWSWYDLLF